MPAQIHPSISQRLLARDAIKLGRFVLNTDQPHQDYFDPPLESPPETTESEQIDLVEVRQDDAKAQAAASLDPIADVSRSKHDQGQVAIATAKSAIYQLSNSRNWFRAALQEQKTRDWFERAILEGSEIYLIVGYQAVHDAQLSKEQSVSKGNAAILRAPIAAALAMAGVVLNFGLSVDPEISRSASKSHVAGESHVALGEQISAVQYRKVRFKWYSSRNLDKAQLEKGSWWKMQWDFRGQESGVNDVVEPQLSDDESE
ncbi:hypothetical protein XPA_002934 [Xanthoria parietina]